MNTLSSNENREFGVAIFTKRLITFLNCGVSAGKALALLKDDPAIQHHLPELGEYFKKNGDAPAGKSFFEDPVFSVFYRQVAEASIHSGGLSSGLAGLLATASFESKW